MNARDVILRIQPNQNILIRDQGYYLLVIRGENMRFRYNIVHDYPFMENQHVIANWLNHYQVVQVIDVNGAIFFIEGYNACWDMFN